MRTTTEIVVGLMRTRDEAQFAAWDLVNCGFPNDDICIRTSVVERHRYREEGEAAVVKASAVAEPPEEGSRGIVYETRVPVGPGDIPALVELGIPEPEADFYLEGMRRGGFLVTVATDYSHAEEAAEIMRRHGAVDKDEAMGGWRAAEMTELRETPRVPWEPAEAPETLVGVPLSHATLQEQLERAEVFEEKEALPRELAEQRRQEKDFASGGAVAHDFGTEVSGVQQYTEPGSMRQEALSRQAGAQGPWAADVSAMDDEEFLRHFRATYGKMGERFDEPYRSAYRFAEAESASHPQFVNKEWYEVEENIHEDWERGHPGTWSRVADAIHFGWDRTRKH